jgi:hypothetical protein
MNIIVRSREGEHATAKIIDLGLAKTVGDSTSESEISVAGRICRYPGICEPRTIRGSASRYPIGSILAWGNALGKAYWQGTILDFVPFCGV